MKPSLRGHAFRRAAFAIAILAATLLGSRPSHAQTFPADSAFVAQLCGSAVSFDPAGDVTGAGRERDVVGTAPSAAIYFYNDGQYLFLRMRVADDPRRGDGTFNPFGWGWEFDTDGNLNTYEYLVMLDGVNNPDQVLLEQNTVSLTTGTPADRAETLLRTYAATDHASVTAAPTMFGGRQNYFITVAIPLADMIAAGIPLGFAVVWSGTSSNAQAINGDLACHDGTTGAPTLGGIPAAPIVVGVAVNITSPADGLTVAQGRPVITGMSQPTSVVTIRIDGSVVGTATTATNGTWSFTPPSVLANGMHSVTATVMDTSGNTATDTNNFTVLATAPSLVITTPANGSVVANPRPPVTGATDPGSTVTISVDGGAPTSASVDAAGGFSFTPGTALTDGTHTITVVATNPSSGSTSTASTTFRVDTVAPPLVINTPVNGSTIANASPNIGGTSEPGAQVSVSIDGGAAPVATADSVGGWTVPTFATLTDGPHTAVATARDAAGNTTTAMVTFTVDTVAPVLTITAPTTGSVLTTSTITVRGTTDPNGSLTVSIDGAMGVVVMANASGMWSFTPAGALADGMHTVRVDAVDGAGNTSNATVTFTIDTTAPALTITSPASGSITNDSTPTITGTTDPGGTMTLTIDGGAPTNVVADGGGAWTFTPTTALADGSHTVNANATDAAGNASSATTTFTVSTTAPPLAITAPTNGSQTNDATPTVSGTTSPGATVTVSVDGGTPIATTADASGNWSVTISTSLGDGSHTVTAQTGSTSAMVTFTVDTAAPAIEITSPATGSFVSTNAPAIIGTAEPNATVEISIDGTGPITTTVDGTGAWSVMPASPLSDGSHTALARAIDAAGNSATASTTFVVDTIAPPITITSPADGSTIGTGTLTVQGTSDPGVMITVTVDGGASTTVTADASGNWSLTVVAPLADGSHTVAARTTDPAGNIGSATSTFTVSSTAPPIAITSPASGSTVNNATPMIGGTASPGATVNVTIDGGAPVSVTADASGMWSFTPSMALGEGMHAIVASTTDSLGHTGNANASFTVDTTAPALAITMPANGSSTTQRQPVIAGTTEPGAIIVVTIDGGAPITVTADSTGAWSFTPATALGDGMHSVHASTSDAAGNTAVADSTFTVAPTSMCMPSSCGGTTPVCDATTGMCRGCSNDSECSGSTPACASSGACVQCTDTMHALCVAATPACNAANACVQCTATMRDACLAEGPGSACLPGNRCGCTRESDCAADRHCDTARSQCVPRDVDGGVDAGRDASADARSDVAGDARPDGSVSYSVTGDGACGCRTPGQSTRSPIGLVALGAAVAAVLSSRRRRGGSR